LALKFLGEADSKDGLWRVLMKKKCAMTEWPADMLEVSLEPQATSGIWILERVRSFIPYLYFPLQNSFTPPALTRPAFLWH
jgi:hypothetical protein